MRKISKLFSASRMQILISTVGVLALLAFSSVIVFEALKSTVVINDNGEERRVQTHVDTVEELLAEEGITVGEHDELSHRLSAEIESGMTIDYKTAKEVIVNVNGEKDTYYTTLDTIEDFLLDHNLKLSKHDELSHELSDQIEEGMQIDIAKAFEVPVVNGGTEKNYWATGGTIKDFLDDHDITYNENSHDKLNVKLDDDIDEETKIKIVRVEKEEKEVEETVPFDVETREDDSLEKGEEKVLTEGEEGLVVKVFEMTHEDGELTAEELIETEVKKESQNKVIAIGTKEKEEESEVAAVASQSSTEKSKAESKSSSESESSDAEPSDGKTITMTASAYTANCSGCSGHTSTGIDLNANPDQKVVAVDPNVIPLGTKVWVEGYGEAVAGDTGGAIQGNRIDLHFPTEEDALAFGQKTVTVKILD